MASAQPVLITYTNNRFPPEEVPNKNVPTLVFTYDRWNDFGHHTLFGGYLFYLEEKYEIGGVKILFEDDALASGPWRSDCPKAESHDKFQDLCAYINSGKDSYEYSNKYVSVADDVEFYKLLAKSLSISLDEQQVEKAVKYVIDILHDAGYVSEMKKEYQIGPIIESDAFKTSLLRTTTAIKSFKEVWLKYSTDQSEIDYSFSITSTIEGKEYPISIDFSSGLLPSNINVLIGANGAGKTKTIQSLYEGLRSSPLNWGADSSNSRISGFPAFRNVVHFSYSPFEEYDFSLFGKTEKIGFLFFGVKDSSGNIDISKPEIDATSSLLKALMEDERKEKFDEGSRRYDFISTVLSKDAGIGYDDVYFALKEGLLFDSDYCISHHDINYVSSTFLAANNAKDFIEDIDTLKPALLVKNNHPVYLSSGQKMFYYITACLVGNIGDETLVIMDEPECYLHPTLEIVLMRILKKFLNEFHSYALVATHSMVIAREIPARCINILNKTDTGISVRKPDFETFGARLMKICSHVFDDYDRIKPFQEWAKKEFSDVDPNDLLGEEEFRNLSPELIAYLAWGK